VKFAKKHLAAHKTRRCKLAPWGRIGRVASVSSEKSREREVFNRKLRRPRISGNSWAQVLVMNSQKLSTAYVPPGWFGGLVAGRPF